MLLTATHEDSPAAAPAQASEAAASAATAPAGGSTKPTPSTCPTRVRNEPSSTPETAMPAAPPMRSAVMASPTTIRAITPRPA